MKANSKGFTLIELLAVIVVLAILILLALPNVLRMMENAQRRAFIVEANTIINTAQSAYTEDAMSGTKEACYSYNYLLTKGYIQKKTGGYTGSVYIKMNASGIADITLWLSNGSYVIGGTGGITPDDLNKADYTPANGATADNTCGGKTSPVLKS